LEKIIEACGLQTSDKVVEIGTGLGALTLMLARKAQKVVTVEIDKALHPALKEILAANQNVELIIADILTLDWEKELERLAGMEQVILCGNLPYNITSPLLFKIIEHRQKIKYAVLMIQKEVGDRLLAKPGTKEYGLLTVMASWKADIFTVARVSKNCFYPVPEVESMIIKLIPHQEPRVFIKNEDLFVRLVRESFQKRRKTMSNVIKGLGLVDRDSGDKMLNRLGIDPFRRGETLPLEKFALIANALSNWGDEDDILQPHSWNG
jgi:16S rRNA (adenine1518-N6/adenine1519-N6)-dimethyltransferase